MIGRAAQVQGELSAISQSKAIKNSGMPLYRLPTTARGNIAHCMLIVAPGGNVRLCLLGVAIPQRRMETPGAASSALRVSVSIWIQSSLFCSLRCFRAFRTIGLTEHVWLLASCETNSIFFWLRQAPICGATSSQGREVRPSPTCTCRIRGGFTYISRAATERLNSWGLLQEPFP